MWLFPQHLVGNAMTLQWAPVHRGAGVHDDVPLLIHPDLIGWYGAPSFQIQSGIGLQLALLPRFTMGLWVSQNEKPVSSVTPATSAQATWASRPFALPRFTGGVLGMGSIHLFASYFAPSLPLRVGLHVSMGSQSMDARDDILLHSTQGSFLGRSGILVPQWGVGVGVGYGTLVLRPWAEHTAYDGFRNIESTRWMADLGFRIGTRYGTDHVQLLDDPNPIDHMLSTTGLVWRLQGQLGYALLPSLHVGMVAQYTDDALRITARDTLLPQSSAATVSNLTTITSTFGGRTEERTHHMHISVTTHFQPWSFLGLHAALGFAELWAKGERIYSLQPTDMAQPRLRALPFLNVLLTARIFPVLEMLCGVTQRWQTWSTSAAGGPVLNDSAQFNNTPMRMDQTQLIFGITGSWRGVQLQAVVVPRANGYGSNSVFDRQHAVPTSHMVAWLTLSYAWGGHAALNRVGHDADVLRELAPHDVSKPQKMPITTIKSISQQVLDDPELKKAQSLLP